MTSQLIHSAFLIQNPDSFQIKADIPGVSKDEIKIDVDQYVITISASRSRTSSNQVAGNQVEAGSGEKVEVQAPEVEGDEEARKIEKSGGQNILRFERFDSFISRSFRLPKSADMNKIDAKYENGVLHLMVHKKEGEMETRRTINVQ
jgi:HSP20 family protein